MKKVQAIFLTVVWLFLFSAIGRVLMHMAKEIQNFEQGITFFGFIVIIGAMMFALVTLIYGILKESFERQ